MGNKMFRLDLEGLPFSKKKSKKNSNKVNNNSNNSNSNKVNNKTNNSNFNTNKVNNNKNTNKVNNRTNNSNTNKVNNRTNNSNTNKVNNRNNNSNNSNSNKVNNRNNNSNTNKVNNNKVNDNVDNKFIKNNETINNETINNETKSNGARSNESGINEARSNEIRENLTRRKLNTEKKSNDILFISSHEVKNSSLSIKDGKSLNWLNDKDFQNDILRLRRIHTELSKRASILKNKGILVNYDTGNPYLTVNFYESYGSSNLIKSLNISPNVVFDVTNKNLIFEKNTGDFISKERDSKNMRSLLKKIKNKDLKYIFEIIVYACDLRRRIV